MCADRETPCTRTQTRFSFDRCTKPHAPRVLRGTPRVLRVVVLHDPVVLEQISEASGVQKSTAGAASSSNTYGLIMVESDESDNEHGICMYVISGS